MAERAVQTFKSEMQKLKEGSFKTKVAHFLFTYRITPQSGTEVSPSELMFRRKMQTHLDSLHPDLARKVHLNQERQKQGKIVMLNKETSGLAKQCMLITMDLERF